MLQQFREFSNKPIVRWLFVLFLAVPFGLFGIDYYFKGPIGGDAIASVGPQRINQVEIDRQQFRGQFDPAIMENPEIRRAVMDRLVNEKLVALGADRAGIRIGDK